MSDLAAILAATRSPADLTQPQRVEILLDQGVAGLTAAVFGETLLDPVHDRAQDEAWADLERWQQLGYRATSILEPDYPRYLAGVREAPAIIYSAGDLQSGDSGVSIVGSRAAGQTSLRAAAEISHALAAQQITVISGLAAGIDAAAHTAALEAGGRTVAVMGTGLEHTYPPENRALRQRIEHSGLVLSQFEPSQRGSKKSFPMRNAVMSGYGRATIIVTAGEKSGTRHQAKAAVGHSHGLILTPSVAEQTSWGRDYVANGLAQVAHSPQEAADLAQRIISLADSTARLFA